MRIGIVSDVHGNVPALEAVLRHMGAVDRLICLGDFVGYGPWPNECVDMLRARDVVSIAGNHDLAAIGTISTEDFNPDAARAAAWTAEQLSPGTRAFLESLDPLREADGVTLAHGSPREPVWEYLLSLESATSNFPEFATTLCLVGHSHVPCLFVQRPGGEVAGSYVEPGTRLTIGPERYIANPGSVGQPRDRDARAAYAVLDDERTGVKSPSLEWQRVDYDIAAVQKQILAVGLPRYLADRLSRGS